MCHEEPKIAILEEIHGEVIGNHFARQSLANWAQTQGLVVAHDKTCLSYGEEI